MIAVLIWLAGCIFGAYAIWYFGLWHAALDLAICGSWFLWVLAGAAWLGRKARPLRTPGIRGAPSKEELEALKRAAQHAAEREAPTRP